MKSKLIILFLFLGVFVKAQTTYLLDAFEYSTDALAYAAYVPSETYGEILNHSMTGNTAPSPYIAVASTTYAGSGAYKAFDYDETGGDATYWQANASTGTLRQYTSTYYIPTSYTVEAPSANASTYSPKAWTFECSTDGTNWTTCGTETNQTGWSNSEQRSYNCTNVLGQYRYFRLNVTSNNTGTYLAIGEFYVTGGNSFVWSESTTKKQGSYSLRCTYTANASALYFSRTVSPTVNLTGLKYIHFALRSATATASFLSVAIRDAGGTTTTLTYNLAAIDVWYQCYIDLSAVSDANKDAISLITLTINTAVANTFYIDNFHTTTNIFGLPIELIYPQQNIFF